MSNLANTIRRQRSYLLAGFFLVSVAAFFLLVTPATAQPTPTINYQGKLSDNTGAAVVDGTYNVRFWLFENTGQATTSALWSESLTGANQVSVVNGLFSVMLGSTSPLTSVDFNQPLFLGVEIGGTGSPTWDGEMLPRKPFGSVPAAFQAQEADNAQTLGGIATTSFLRSDAPDSMDAFLTLTAGAQTSDLVVVGTATTTNLVVGSDFISDLTGVGLTITGNALSVSSSSLNLTLSGLTDTNLTSPAEGDLFSYNGSEWVNVATSSLGFVDTGATDFLSLTDTPGSFNANRILFQSGSAVTDSANFTFDGTALTIGGMTISDVLTTHTGASTTTVPSNNPYAWTISTGVGVPPLFRIDTTTGQEFVNIGNGTGDVLIGGIGSGSNLVFEESSTISGQGTNTVTLGESGDTFNVAASFFGVGTSTPSQPFTIATNALLTGALFDRTYSAGTNGMVMQTTGTGVQWVATSTLGFGTGDGTVTSVALSAPTGFTVGGSPVTTAGTLTFDYAAGYEGLLSASSTNWNSFYNTPSTRITAGTNLGWTGNTLDVTGLGDGTFLGLTDTPGSYTVNRLLFQTGSAVTDSADLTFDGTTFSVGVNQLLAGANRYLNFSTATGSAGYGIRDNTGALEYKNLAGSWAALGGPLTSNVGVDESYDISTATFDSIALSVGDEDTVPVDMLFNDNGTVLYVLGETGDDINAYTLSVPYDISSATFDSIALSVGGQESRADGMIFNGDGTVLYVTGWISDNVYAYTLSVPYDISSGTLPGVVAISVAAQDATPRSMLFNEDGSVFYVLGFASDNVYAYSLSVVYDVSSSISTTTALSFGAQEGSPNDMEFNGDGTVLYIIGTDGADINAYNLSVPYDITTASFDSIALSVSSQDTDPNGLLFNNDGTVLYVLGETGRDINAYTMVKESNEVYVTDVTQNFAIGTTTPTSALTVVGDTTLTGTLSVTGDILSGNTLTYDLGSAASRFANLWAETLNVGTSTWSIFNATNGRLAFSNAAEQGGSEYLSILDDGSVGIGTSTPSQRLTVDGNFRLTGALFDSNNASGTNGMVMQTTGAGTQWVATSSLGFLSDLSGSSFLELSDTPSSYTANRLLFQTGSAVTDSADLTFNGTDLNVGGNNGYSIGGSRVLYASSTNFSLAIGDGALANQTSNLYNLAIGRDALTAASGGGSNIAIGDSALSSNITGGTNIAIGRSALLNANSVGTVAIGYFSGRHAVGAEKNVLIGEQSGEGNVAGSLNVAIGYRAFENAATTSNSVVIGAEAVQSDASAQLNNLVAIGYRAGYALTTGASSNILIGYNAGNSITTGASNIVIGSNADTPNSTDSNFLNIGNTIYGNLSTSNVSLGTTTALYKLTVDGDAYLTGAFRDSFNSAGTNGMVMQTTGSGVQWVATSTLGFGSGDGTVTSVALSAPTGFTVGGSPITSAGTLALSYAAGYEGLLSASSTNWNSFYNTPSSRISAGTGLSWTGNTINAEVQSSDLSNYLPLTGGTLSGNLIFSGTAANIALGSNWLSGDGDDEGVFVSATGNVGIGTSTPDFNLTFSGTSNQTIGMGRAATGAGNDLTIEAGGGQSGVESNGGGLILSSGKAYRDNSSADGNYSTISFKTTGKLQPVAGLVPIGFPDDVLPTTKMTILGNGRVGIGSTTPSAMLTVQASGIGDLFNLTSTTSASLLRVTDLGNVGIGTTTPQAKLSLQNLTLDGAGVSGIDQYLVTTNSVDAAVQFGNRSYISASNTATTTLVGNMYRVADNTTFGNTIRGLEVQSYVGSNTQGENTALSGFARTFGVRGSTEGDAGALYEPAGGFFETNGSTQGNAIRGYSGSVTTANLLALYQDTSAFTGTGLEMDFGNGGGSFSGAGSKFIDLQNAGTSKFQVYQDGVTSIIGTTTIGTGDTSQMAGLQIGYGGLCVDNDGSCASTVLGRISSVSSFTGNSDLAEMYFSSQALTPGEMVVADGFLSVRRATGAAGEQILGVVSTKPGLLLGSDDTSLRAGQTGYPLALSGRVPVQLSNENGDIAVGDPLALSSLPGVAMKARNGDVIVGYALEAFDGTRAYTDGYINQFGDDIAAPNYDVVPTLTDTDKKADCYYGAGGATGQDEVAPCNPEDVNNVGPDYAEVEAVAQARFSAEQAALEELYAEPAKSVRIAGGQRVAVGNVTMFVDRGYYLAADARAMLGDLVSTSTELVLGADDDSGETLWNRLKELAQNFVDGVLTIAGINTERVQTNELCVDDVCITADDLRTLLDQEVPLTADTTTPPIPDTSDTTAPDTTDTEQASGGGQIEQPVATTTPTDTTEQPATSTPPVEVEEVLEDNSASPTPETIEEPVEELIPEPPVTEVTEPPVEEESLVEPAVVEPEPAPVDPVISTNP